MEGGEDIDLDQPTAWVPFFAVGGFFLANAVLIEPVGWPITGTLLFFGSAVSLGSRRIAMTLVVAAVVAFGSYLLFVHALGAYLPAGILQGVI
jgi:putative tricarboxylic transport membrane protein